MTTTEQTWPPRRPAPGAAAGLELVIVDVETTGWLPDQAAITEIGAVKIGGSGPRAEFTALVNPGSAIPAEIATLTGITDEMVGQAPPISAVLPSFLAFARGCVLAAHNAPFDIGFLTAACRQSGLQWPAFSVLDTAALARLMLTGEVPDCRLATLAAHFSAQTLPCHRALADARATADVLQGLFSRLAAAGVLTVPGVPLPAPPAPAPPAPASRRPAPDTPAYGPGTGQPIGTAVPAGTGQPIGTAVPAGTGQPIGTAVPAGTGQPIGTAVPADTDQVPAGRSASLAAGQAPVSLAAAIRSPARGLRRFTSWFRQDEGRSGLDAARPRR